MDTATLRDLCTHAAQEAAAAALRTAGLGETDAEKMEIASAAAAGCVAAACQFAHAIAQAHGVKADLEDCAVEIIVNIEQQIRDRIPVILNRLPPG